MGTNTNGSYNTALGADAGYEWTTGLFNVAVGVGATGSAGDSGVIHIGGKNNQTKTHIEGIGSATGTFLTDVCIDVSTDQLGPCSESSFRVKEDIQPLADQRDAIASLRPVSFRYREAAAGKPGAEMHHGLIAEEVMAVLPSIVTRDEQDRPHTVRYDLLAPLLLAEVQRLNAEVVLQDQVVADLRRIVADQGRRLDLLSGERPVRRD